MTILEPLRNWMKKHLNDRQGIAVTKEAIPGVVNNYISHGLADVCKFNGNEIVLTGETVVVYNTGELISKYELVIFTSIENRYVCKTSRFIFENNGGTGTGSGTGTGTGCGTNMKSIRLIKSKKEILGTGFHRSGWPYVYKNLEIISNENGIMFDDFIEQNFCYKNKPKIYDEPWIGVFHHPPSLPYFGNQRENLELAFQKPEFIESAKNLKLAISLSEHLSNFLRKHLDCKVITLKHPFFFPWDTWTPDKFIQNNKRRLIQLGFYLRNTQLIRQIPPCQLIKSRLWINRSWVTDYDKRIQEFWTKNSLVQTYDDFEDLDFVPPGEFDKLLCENVICMEVFEASANNGVLDCIARNTPLIINKHPAVVEYLGEDYPLYFDFHREIPDIIENVMEGYEYLADMDKSCFRIEKFLNDVLIAIESI